MLIKLILKTQKPAPISDTPDKHEITKVNTIETMIPEKINTVQEQEKIQVDVLEEHVAQIRNAFEERFKVIS